MATESAAVEQDPLPPLSAPLVQIVVVPSLTVIVPVGVPAPGATAAADSVNVTDWPKTDGFTEELIEVAVEALLITWITADEVEVAVTASVL